MRVEWFQRAQFAINLSAVFRRCQSDVNGSCGGCGDHVHSCAAANFSDVECYAALWIHQLRYFKNLMRELDDGALTFFEIKAGMCGDSGDLERVFAHAFTRCLDRAMQSVRRLKH